MGSFNAIIHVPGVFMVLSIYSLPHCHRMAATVPRIEKEERGRNRGREGGKERERDRDREREGESGHTQFLLLVCLPCLRGCGSVKFSTKPYVLKVLLCALHTLQLFSLDFLWDSNSGDRACLPLTVVAFGTLSSCWVASP